MKAYNVAVRVLDECGLKLEQGTYASELDVLVDSLDDLLIQFDSVEDITQFCGRIQFILMNALDKKIISQTNFNVLYSMVQLSRDRVIKSFSSVVKMSRAIIGIYSDPNMSAADVLDIYDLDTLKRLLDFPEYLKRLFYSNDFKSEFRKYILKLIKVNPEKISGVVEFLIWANIIPDSLGHKYIYYVNNKMWNELINIINTESFNTIEDRTSLFQSV